MWLMYLSYVILLVTFLGLLVLIWIEERGDRS